MQEFQITCVRRGSNDITTHVGIGFSQTLFVVSEIVNNIVMVLPYIIHMKIID